MKNYSELSILCVSAVNTFCCFVCGGAMFGTKHEVNFGDYTAEALRTRSKEFLMIKYSELCVLCVSAVNTVFSFGWGYLTK